MKNMQRISLELPYAMFDMRRVKRVYSNGNGRETELIGYGSYLCDYNGGRTFVTGEYPYDGNRLRFRDGNTISGYMNEDKADWRSRSQRLIRDRIQMLNDRDVNFLGSMTNTHPTSKDNVEEVFDFLDVLADGLPGNGVIVSHPKILTAIRKRYGDNIHYVSSVIRHYNKPVSYRYLFSIFDDVVLKPEDVLTPAGEVDEHFFRELGQERINRSVVMLNPLCKRDCLYGKEHYAYISEREKSYPLYSGIRPENWVCSKPSEGKMVLNREHVKQVIEMGVRKFKIGRNETAIRESLLHFPEVTPFRETKFT